MQDLLFDSIGFVWKLGLLFFELSVVLGNAIVDTGHFLVNTVVSIVSSTSKCCVIVLNDYAYFINEILDLINEIGNAGCVFKDLLGDGFFYLAECCNAFVNTLWFFIQPTIHGLHYVINSTLNVIFLFVGGLNFLGWGVVTLFIDAPKRLLLFIISAPGVLLKVMHSAISYLSTLCDYVDKTIFSLAGKVSIYTYVGCITALILTSTLLLHYTILANGGRRVLPLIRQVITRIWTGQIFNRRNQRMPIDNAGDSVRSLAPVVDADSNAMCIVCLTSQKNVLNLPCRHVACCYSCSAKLPSRLCPLCRVRVRRTMVIYV